MMDIINGQVPQLIAPPEDAKQFVESVSYHLPLHRVLAAFLHRGLPLFTEYNAANKNAAYVLIHY